jgi:hypothetical protein
MVLAAPPACEDDCSAGLRRLFTKARDVLRPILEVAIHDQHIPAARLCDARRNSGVLPKVATEANGDDMGVYGAQLR